MTSASRSYNDDVSRYSDWLTWDSESTSFASNKFGKNGYLNASLDIEGFVLSINSQKQDSEHLVLSGMTYPMAFGWMNIKLDKFGLDGDIFRDDVDYQIERGLHPNEEMNIDSLEAAENLALHYSNVTELFAEINGPSFFSGTVLVNPANANVMLINTEDASMPKIGFSPGDKIYPVPYFYLLLSEQQQVDGIDFMGMWNNRDWRGPVLIADDFLAHNPEDERQRVLNFLSINYSKLG